MAAFSPDDRRILTESYDLGSIWDPVTHKANLHNRKSAIAQVWELPNCDKRISSFISSTDGMFSFTPPTAEFTPDRNAHCYSSG